MRVGEKIVTKPVIVTTFKSRETRGKKPLSPYDDLTFDFKTVECDLPGVFRLMVSNFILNLPITSSIRLHRRKSELLQYYPQTFNYLIIDVDKVGSSTAMSAILKYFKNYRCIIGASRSHNGVTNFNLKGVLAVEPLKHNELKLLAEQIGDDLRQYGELDTSSTRFCTVNAPINKYTVLMENQNGCPYKFVYRPTYSSKSLTEMLDGRFTIPQNIDTAGAETVSDLCLKIFGQMGFSAIRANGKCTLFSHPSETKTPGGYFWFEDSPFIMHHYNAVKSVNIFNLVKDLPRAKQLLNKKIDYAKKFFSLDKDINYNHVISINEKIIAMSDCMRDAVSSFLNQKGGLFTIKSPMGTGKSTIISQIIRDGLDLDLRILVCTNRISIANDFKKKYNLKAYNEDKYKLNDSIIVQYDSIWRYNIKNFDLVVFDEFTSLLLHSRNSINNTGQNLAKFFACFNCKLVIADAFLTGYENVFLQRKTDNLWLVENTYRENIPVYQYTDYNCFIRSILIHAKKHKLTISCTSLNIISALKIMLESHGVRVVTLTADTQKCTRKIIYELFQVSDNSKYDVLIYSPTLTVGVSNLNNVDYHFHYDSSNTCDVISSLQMIRRTRKATEIHLYVKNHTNYLKTTYNEIKDDYIENASKEGYFFNFTNYGELRLTSLGEKIIYVDLLHNILEYNHKNAFEFLLTYQFENSPSVISKTFTSNILLPYIKTAKSNNADFKNSALEEYLKLSNFDRKTVLDYKKQNLFEIFETVEDNIKNGCPDNIRAEILKKQLANPKFIQAIKNYKLLNAPKDDIKSHISYCLIRDRESVNFWNSVLEMNKIEREYPPGVVDNTPKLKNILTKCGYTLSNDLIRVYKVSNDVETYKGWIK